MKVSPIILSWINSSLAMRSIVEVLLCTAMCCSLVQLAQPRCLLLLYHCSRLFCFEETSRMKKKTFSSTLLFISSYFLGNNSNLSDRPDVC